MIIRQILFFTFFTFLYVYVVAQKATYFLYLHGSYTDSDWEQIELMKPQGADKIDIYYNYAESKKGKLKLEVKEKLEIGGSTLIKVEFPVIKKIYYLKFSQDFAYIKMTDEKGSYEKDFSYVSGEIKSSENTKPSTNYVTRINKAFDSYLKVNPDYCSEADCDKAHQDLMNGREMSCSIGVEEGSISYIYGDINQDGEMDALVNFGLIQCDGGNALCGEGGQALVLSGLSTYKVIEPNFEDGDIPVRHDLLKINSDGTILCEDWYWTEDDPRCMPSLSKKVKYQLEYNTLHKMY